MKNTYAIIMRKYCIVQQDGEIFSETTDLIIFESENLNTIRAEFEKIINGKHEICESVKAMQTDDVDFAFSISRISPLVDFQSIKDDEYYDTDDI